MPFISIELVPYSISNSTFLAYDGGNSAGFGARYTWVQMMTL
jgi:hypothetical protein